MDDAIDSAGTAPSNDRVSLFSDLHVTGICLDFEHQAHNAGFRAIAGLDEVGRGCLAGPVVAAACILEITRPMPAGLNDSKKLSPVARRTIAAQLKEECVAFAIGQIEADEIDQINILEATKKAMPPGLECIGRAGRFPPHRCPSASRCGHCATWDHKRRQPIRIDRRGISAC